MLREIPLPGSVLRICASSSPKYSQYNRHWGVVTRTYSSSINLRIIGKVIAIANPLVICSYIKQDSKEALVILDRLDRIGRSQQIDDTVNTVLLDIATKYPHISQWQEILLSAIEKQLTND